MRESKTYHKGIPEDREFGSSWIYLITPALENKCQLLPLEKSSRLPVAAWRYTHLHQQTLGKEGRKSTRAMSTTSLAPTLGADGIDFLALETLLSGGPRALI